jgi:hypothetical protein
MDRVASLLEQYPGPVRLPRSRGRLIFLLATTIFMFGTAAYYAIPPDKHDIAGWLPVIFCILCATVIALAFLHGEFELVLDNNGFSICESRHSRRFEWAEVKDFAVIPDELMFFRKRVGFNRADTELDETNGFQWRNFHLPESYGLTNAECVRLLSLWQERALRTAARKAGLPKSPVSSRKTC